MKKILSALIFSLLASMISVAPAQAAGQYWQDGDYERICLTLGWTDCAVWRILDKDGAEKNRVIGPGSLSVLTDTCGANFCGGGESATAVKLETLAPWAAPTASSTPAPETSTAPSPTPTPTPTPAQTPTPRSRRRSRTTLRMPDYLAKTIRIPGLTLKMQTKKLTQFSSELLFDRQTFSVLI